MDQCDAPPPSPQCQTCGEPVNSIFDHLDQDCEHD
jgi:hypothetical protein